MKQEIIKHFSSLEKAMFNISKYLHDNPEDGFCEHKSCDYLTTILKHHDFLIENNFLNIPTAFRGTFGSGHPKICYICEYDSIYKKGHILGKNLMSAISICSAIGLSKVISKLHGSVIVIGCPGEFSGGSKGIMTKEGVFDDIDAVLTVSPSTVTGNCASSPAVLPIKILYNTKNFSKSKNTTYSAFDSCLFTLNSINTLVKGYSHDCSIDKISIHGDLIPHIPPNTIETTFSIKAPTLDIANKLKEKIEVMINTLGNLMNINTTLSLTELPAKSLKSNKTLARLFSNNCKEVGIIDNVDDLNVCYGLSLGDLNDITPVLQYFVSITEDSSIKFGSSKFKDETLSDFAIKKAISASEALAITGLDLIEREDLLFEAKEELMKKH